MAIVVKSVFCEGNKYYLYFFQMVCVNVNINNLKMLYHDKIGVSGGIKVNKTSVLNESIICDYWYFLDKRFQFKASV